MTARLRQDDDAVHGRQAGLPTQIPARGWWDVLLRVRQDVKRDNASLIAAGLALYALLAAFPALAAAIALYGLVASADRVVSQFEALAGVLPQQAAAILQGAMQNIASQQGGALGFGAAIGLLIALWSARKGMAALMQAMNIAYNEAEERGFFTQVFISLVFTAGAVVGFVLVALLGVAVPVTAQGLGLPSSLQTVVSVLRWAVLWGLIVLALAVVYRFAPDRRAAKWRWVTWGSAIAATVWLVGSVLFAVYVRNFGSYGETYGALGGVVVLLLWFYLSGFVVMLGAEINSELEQQTERDSTAGPAQPMGRRGAYVADTAARGR